MYINYKGGRAKESTYVLLLGVSNVFKKKRNDVPIKVAPSKKLWAHPSTCY